MDDGLRRAYSLWSEGRQLLDVRTVPTLEKAVGMLTEALGLVERPDLRATVHRDLGIGHLRLARIGHQAHASLAVDHALLACLDNVGLVLAQGATADLADDMELLATAVRLDGVDQSRLAQAQAFLDLHRPLLSTRPAYSELQQGVAEGYLVLLGTLDGPLGQDVLDPARSAFEHTAAALRSASPPDPDRLALVLANRSFFEMLAARDITQLHSALDLAFSAEAMSTDQPADGPSMRTRILACLHRSAYTTLTVTERWQIRYRLWDQWAGDWMRALDSPVIDPQLRPPLSDWFAHLLMFEDEDMPAAPDSDPDGPLSLEIRQYASALVQLGGYPVGLVVVLMGQRLGGRVIPPEDLFTPEWVDLAREPWHMFAAAGFFAVVREAVAASRHGLAASVLELETAFGHVDTAHRDDAAPYFLWACMEVATTDKAGHAPLMRFALELAMRVPDPDRFAVMWPCWRKFMHFAITLEHRRVAQRWTRELVRLAEIAHQDNPSTDTLFRLVNTGLQAAKVRAVVDSDDMDEEVSKLGHRIEELRGLDGHAALALEVDLIRLRAQIANDQGDHSTFVARLADCVRLITAHSDPAMGSILYASVNLIVAVSRGPASTIDRHAHEIADAARVVLADLSATLAVGAPGATAVAALSTRRLAGIVNATDAQKRSLVTAVRAASATTPELVGSLESTEQSLTETLALCRRIEDGGDAEDAVLTLLQWLMGNVDRLVHGRRARRHHCGVALALQDRVHASDQYSEPVRMLVRYAAGETARHAGVRVLAREHLSVALEEARSHPSPPIPAAAIECDLAVLMVEIAADDHDAAAARHWLDLLFASPMTREPSGVVPLGHAVLIFVREFGVAGVEHRLAEVYQALRSLMRPDQADPMVPVRAAVLQTDLLLATADAAGLPELLPRLAVMADAAPPPLEAVIRQSRVGALAAVGDVTGMRLELDRLGFLQDVAIGMTTRFDDLFHADHVGGAQLVAAAAAADAGEVDSAVSVLEQGRLRLLRRLRAGIDESAPDSAEPLRADLDEDGFWDALTDIAAEEQPTRFGVPESDWTTVFQDVSIAQILEIAARCGTVTYQFVRDHQLRQVFLLNDGTAFCVGPIDVVGQSASTHDRDLAMILGTAWGRAIMNSTAGGFAARDLRPVLICAGDQPDLAVITDRAFTAASIVELGEPRLLNHLPSARFAIAEQRDPSAHTPLADPVRLLHIGDASNTLFGPWLEAAQLQHVTGVQVHSLLGADSTEAAFHEQLPDASMIVASCHGARNRGGVLGSSLMVGSEGLSVLDVTTRHSLAHIDTVFLASCEMGRRLDEHHERESVSFANAALVSGCGHVISAVLPVNDLISAIVVDEFCRRLPGSDSLSAYQAAMAAVRAMSRADMADRVHAMWEVLRQSPLSQRMPWPVRSAARVFEQSVRRAFDHVVRTPVFFVSSNGG